MIRRLLRVSLPFAMMLCAPAAASAQLLGTFTWQLQPFCNRLTFVVIQAGPVYTLDGYDDGCAGERRAAAGVASLNPDGTVSIGFSYLGVDWAEPMHVKVTLSVATLSGTWRDDGGYDGVFALNGAAAGNAHPGSAAKARFGSGYFGTARYGGGAFFALAHDGPAAAPTAVTTGTTLGRFGAGGHTGGAFNWPTAMMSMSATEDWTPAANGSELRFETTPNGSSNLMTRMVLDQDGSVGIGTTVPADRLDVNGDIRIGTSGTNGCVRNNNGGGLVGVCASDARFKQNVSAYAPRLDRVAALRPVQFSWRASAFPERRFGAAREIGLIAQDVEAVLPDLVVTGDDGYKAVDYSQLPLLAIQAIRELKEKNDALEQRLATLEAALRALSSRDRED